MMVSRFLHAAKLPLGLLLALTPAATAFAQSPPNLTPGTPATVTLGQIQNLAKFNTSIATFDISYSNSDLTSRQYVVRLPSGFNPADTTKRYGLVTYIDAGNGSFPSTYAAALDAHDVIWISGTGIDNSVATNTRRGVALMGAFRMTELYPIDSARIYAAGLSGGGRTASDLAYLRTDFFRGFIGRVGASIPGTIPGWECAGTNSGNSDVDYEYMSVNAADPSVVLPAAFRTALITQTGDFRRAELLAIYRWGHLNHGNTVRAIVRPGSHSDEVGDSFTDAVRFLYHPHVDVIWDRFENSLLAANVLPGKTVAGTGFTALAGDVSETTYAYNSVTHGVLRLAGDGALAQANDTFTWKDNSGILLDARLRSQNATTAGQNQQIGLHLVIDGSTGPVSSRPGFHLYWCYGASYRAELVTVSGERRTLATWEHTATHPMSLSATDKTFWGDTAAPDFAGKTKSFRGEDVRLVLNATGFQLTFNRYANNLQTAYPDVVVLTSESSSTPYAEHIPMTIQGLWSLVETTAFNALPAGNYRLLVSNTALVTGQSVGTALVDEIRLVGSSGQQAAPATVTVTAPANGQRYLSWTPVHGALAYAIERSTSPDSGFTSLTTVPNIGWTAPNATSSAATTNPAHTDTTASLSSAYYYRVTALGVNATPGRVSAPAFAARSGTLPAAPTGLAVTYPAAFQARLAWTDAATNETAYRVERSPAGFAQWTLVSGQLAAGTTSFTDTTVSAGTAYDYRVSALNAAGLSGYATVTATIPDAAPPTPAGLAVTATTFTSASLSWTAVPQAASYRVKRSASPSGPFTSVASSLISPSYTDSALSPGQTYHYVVSSVGATLESANSASVSTSTPALLAPTNLTVTPSFTTNTLSWSAVADVSGYTVQRATSLGGPYSNLAENSLSTTYTDTGLSSGLTYFYRIVSLSGSFSSTATNAISATPTAGTFTKANNTNALDTAASWSPAATPTLLDTALWNDTYTNGTVAIGSGLSLGTLRLASPSTAITINAGTGTLTVGSGGIDLSTATQNLTLNAPVTLAAAQTWSIASGRTLTLATPLSTTASPAPALTLGGAGTLTYDGANTVAPFPGPLALNLGTLRANQAAAVLTLNSINLPAATTHTITNLTGASGATWIIDAAPSANLTFASNTAGLNLIVKNGSITYNALSGNTDATNLRVEGGTVTIPATAARYQLAAANQTLQLTGGTLDASLVTSFGLRIGGSGSASQSGAQNVAATHSGGTLLATTLNLGGNNTTASTSPSYTLSGGLLSLSSTASTAFVIGADTAAAGSSTFAFSGGTLRIPGTLSGAQSGARQIFAMSGGTLAAGAINFTNLRSSGAAATGTFTHSGGTLAPGDLGTTGRTAITGNYTLSTPATLALDLGGNTAATTFQGTASQFDNLTVTGTTTLAGNLTVSLIGTYATPATAPLNATTFTVLNSTGTLSGAFANVVFGSRLATTGGEGSFLVSKSGNTVTLSQYLNALDTWRLANFGSTANTGPAADTADPDADGASNLLEYALGTSPTSPTSTSIPSPQVSGNRLELTFLRARPGISYIVETSSDLTTWSTLATNPGSIGQTITVTDTVNLPTATPPRRFLRLRVTAP